MTGMLFRRVSLFFFLVRCLYCNETIFQKSCFVFVGMWSKYCTILRCFPVIVKYTSFDALPTNALILIVLYFIYCLTFYYLNISNVSLHFMIAFKDFSHISTLLLYLTYFYMLWMENVILLFLIPFQIIEKINIMYKIDILKFRYLR